MTVQALPAARAVAEELIGLQATAARIACEQMTALARQAGSGIRLGHHLVTGMLHAGRGCHQEALEEFSAAERLRSQLTGSLALASQVTGWLLAAQARLAMTGSGALLAALPGHQAAHAALLTDILDLMHSSSLTPQDRHPAPSAGKLSPGELRVLGYLPPDLSRPEIATELSVSVNTVSTHIRGIYAKLGAGDRSSAAHRARELRLLSAVRTLAR